MSNTLSWFEIFVTDMSRAKAFYEQVLGTQLRPEKGPSDEPHAIFPDKGQSGALVERKGKQPSSEGALIYVDVTGKLDAVLGRVAAAGGRVTMPKTDIGPPGFIAVIADSEGNSVGLHSERQ